MPNASEDRNIPKVHQRPGNVSQRFRCHTAAEQMIGIWSFTVKPGLALHRILWKFWRYRKPYNQTLYLKPLNLSQKSKRHCGRPGYAKSIQISISLPTSDFAMGRLWTAPFLIAE